MVNIQNSDKQVSSLSKTKGMFYGASPILFELAKKCRNNVTDTEMILWGKLKQEFPKLKFRRQHPISIYIADLYCHSEKMVIEIDGTIHDSAEAKLKDKERQQHLEELGLTVIRFTNKEILHSLEVVMQTIKNNLKQ